MDPRHEMDGIYNRGSPVIIESDYYQTEFSDPINVQESGIQNYGLYIKSLEDG